MSAQLVPIRLGLTAGDLYTVWAPRWRDGGDDWEGFLGKGDDLYAFGTVADLVAFVRTDTDNDLSDHPAWPKLTKANAHKFEPSEDRVADLIAVAEVLAEKPTEAGVEALANTLAVVSSIGSVCELPAVMRFFNGNPNLGLVAGGIAQFTGRAGRKRWDLVGEIVARGWDTVVSEIDDIVTTPAVDEGAAAAAAAELEQPFEDEPEELAEAEADAGGDEDDDESTDEGAARGAVSTVLGGDEKFWEHVGIDPIRVMTGGGTYYTLRCYYGDKPLFLGRNGRITVFPSERTLARYLADEHDHDLSDLPTYDDVRTAATDGSLRIEVTADNVYVLNGLTDDLAAGPEGIDRDQLALAVEFIRDVGTYSEDDAVKKLLASDTAVGGLVGYLLDPASADRPEGPYAAAASQWEELEGFVESRLRRE